MQFRSVAIPVTISVKRTILAARGQRVSKCGQVAQVVERSPEKAGVGGSTPSLATIILKNLAESRLTLPVRSQSAIFWRDSVPGCDDGEGLSLE